MGLLSCYDFGRSFLPFFLLYWQVEISHSKSCEESASNVDGLSKREDTRNRSVLPQDIQKKRSPLREHVYWTCLEARVFVGTSALKFTHSAYIEKNGLAEKDKATMI